MLKVPLFATVINHGTNLEVWRNKQCAVIPLPFRPYFYSKEPMKIPCITETIEKVKFISDMKEHKVFKYDFGSVADVPIYRNDGSMEADIPFIQRVCIDRPDFFSKYPNDNELDVLHFDIEVDSVGRFPKPESNPIIAISYAFNDEVPVMLEIGKLSKRCDADIIEKFASEVKRFDPDIISTYYGNQFDIPYMIERCALNDIRTDFFTRDVDAKECFFIDEEINNKIIYIKGRALFDIWNEAIKDQTLYGIADKKMKTVANWFNLKEKIRKRKGFEDYNIIVEDLSNTRSLVNTKRLTEYVTSDVLLTQELYKIYFYNVLTLSNILGVPFNIMTKRTSSTLGTVYYARELKKKNIISDSPNWKRFPDIYGLPTEVIKRGKKKTEFVGGTRFQGAIVDINKRYQGKVIKPLSKIDFSCIPEGEYIYTNNGYKKIEYVNIGDKTISMDLKENSIIQKKSFISDELIEIELKNGHIIKVTPNHRLPTKNGIKNANNLKKGDELIKPILEYGIRDNLYDDLFELLGIFVCEGKIYSKPRFLIDKQHPKGRISTYHQTHISVKLHEKKFKSQITKLLKKHVPYDIVWKKRKKVYVNGIYRYSYDIYDTRKVVYDWFKVLKDKYFNLEEITKYKGRIKAFITGVLRSDGCWNIKRYSVQFHNTDRKLHNILCKCLDILGIEYNAVRGIRCYGNAKKLSNYIEVFKKVALLKLLSFFKFDCYRDKNLLSKKLNTKSHNIKFIKIKNIRSIYGKFNVYDLGLKRQGSPYFIHNGYFTHNSLYPNIIRYFGLSPESVFLIGYKAFEDGYFGLNDYGDYYVIEFSDNRLMKNVVVKVEKNTGFLPGVMDKFLTEREVIKKFLVNEKDEEKVIELISKSWGYKVLANATGFGVNGSGFFRYGSTVVALTITAIARFLVSHIKNVTAGKWLEIDTDGIYCIGDVDVDLIADDLNKYLKEKFNIDADFELGLDIYKSGYFMKMKNYVLIDDKDNLVKHGVSFKASSKNAIFSSALNKIARAVLQDPEHLKDVVLNCYKNVDMVEIESFIQRTNINRPLKEYAGQSTAGKKGCLQVQVGMQSEMYHDSPVRVGDSVSYVKVYDGYKIREKVNKKFIDKGYYRNQIISVLKRFNLNKLIWDVEHMNQKLLSDY